jgi:hypothetical protein
MPRPEQVGANWLPTCADSPSQSCPKETRPKENNYATLSLNFQTGLRAPLSSAYHSTTPQGGLEVGLCRGGRYSGPDPHTTKAPFGVYG